MAGVALTLPKAGAPSTPFAQRFSNGRLALLPIIGRRLLLMIPMLFGIVTMTFLLTHAVAGNPSRLLAGQFATPKAIAVISKQYGFDQPLIVQYWHYLVNLLHGNLGTSTLTGHSVVSDLLTRIPSTLELVVLILAVAMAIGIPLGAYAGRTQRKSAQMAIRVVTFVLLATPDFWLGLVAIFVFYFKLNILPAPTGQLDIGATPPHSITGAHVLDSLLEGNWSAFSDTLTHVILPVLVVGFCLSAPLTRLMRSAMIGVMESDSVKFARSMGLGRMQIWRYAVRSALPSAITFAGTVFTLLIGGLVLIETVFSWGGAASYAATAIQGQDFNATQGFVLFCGFASVIAFLAVDLIQMAIDPRVRLQSSGAGTRPGIQSLNRLLHRSAAPPVLATPPRRTHWSAPIRDIRNALVELVGDISVRRAPAAIGRFIKSKNIPMFVGLGIVAALVIGSFVVPALSPYGVLQSNPAASFLAPSLHHPFGTDQVGYDIFVRVWSAVRLDLSIAVEGVLLSAVAGVVLGVVIGYSRRRLVDEVAMRIVDMIQSFPLLIAAVTIIAFAGNHLINVVGAIAFINTPIFLRLTRSQVLSIREHRYIEAATALGNTRARVVLRHIIPNSLGPVIVQFGTSLGYAIITIAGLAFLGVGIQAPTAEWGSMILTGQASMTTGQWWTVVFPGLALLVAVIGFNLFAEGVERARDIYR
jgi:peptide/nickel transport system permease protein